MDNQPIQVLVVDDHAMVRNGLKALLQEYEDIQVIGVAGSGVEAIELVERLKPDVVLMDLLMPGMDGVEAIRQIIALQPDQRILVLTALLEDDAIIQSIKAGAMGYARKDIQPEELVRSIRNVHAGEPAISPRIAWELLLAMNGAKTTEQTEPSEEHLTERELEVLCMVARGHTDREIAEVLCITDVTVRTHVRRILKKLGLNNRVQAALYSYRTGLVSIAETSYEDLAR